MINRIFQRRLARLALTAAVQGAATAAGSSIITLTVWWVLHR